MNLLFTGRQLRRCSKCGGKMEQVNINKICCFACGNEEKTDLRKLRDALEEYGNLTPLQLSKATGVPREVINAYVEEGTLQFKG